MSALLTPDLRRGHDACMPAQNPVASRLSRDVVVDAYLRLVETEDNDSVSLRRLGSELGVDLTAVYRYFRDMLLLGKGLTGAVASIAYMFAPWADSLGGSG
jgi:hypothetical protein